MIRAGVPFANLARKVGVNVEAEKTCRKVSDERIRRTESGM